MVWWLHSPITYRGLWLAREALACLALFAVPAISFPCRNRANFAAKGGLTMKAVSDERRGKE
jgi:hypothetical protein